MSQTIGTGWEIVKNSPLSDKLPISLIEPHIESKELTFARCVIGVDFYELLVADLVAYIGLTTWKSSATYSADDYVNYFGTILKSKVNSNTLNPCEDADENNWEVARKFTSDCYENLWNRHLKKYFAFYIISECIDYITFPAGVQGFVEQYDDNTGTKTASKSTFGMMKTKLINDTSELLENLKYYVKKIYNDEESSCDFSDVLFIKDSRVDQSTFKKQRRRFAFRK